MLLKPNLVEYEPGTVINTHPNVIVGAAIALKRAGAREVVVAEGPGHRRDIEYLITSTGLFDHLREERLRSSISITTTCVRRGCGARSRG